MKRLVLVFEKLLNVHLVKDVGQIPYLLGRYFGFSVSIACMNIDRYTHLNNEVKGLKLHFVTLSSYIYLIFNARKIDVCMLFHIRAKSIYQGILYKLLNPKGFLYIKSDLKDTVLPLIASDKRSAWAQAYNQLIYNYFIRIVDLVSFETLQVYSSITSIPEQKKFYLPNGFDITLPEYYGISPKAISGKQNIILCIARHGAEQKNSELLLQAIEKIPDMGSWKIVFAGEATSDFIAYCDTFRLNNVRHADKIELLGQITDRKRLFELYNDSKIFCLPSRWESWGLVCTEALYFGCVLVMTREVISAPDLTNNGKAGLLAGNENSEEWASVLQKLMNEPEHMERYSVLGKKHFDKHFAWPDALAPLAQRLASRDAGV